MRTLGTSIFLNQPIDFFVNSLQKIYPRVDAFYFIVYTPWVSNAEQRLGGGNKETDRVVPLFGEIKWNFERTLINKITDGEHPKKISNRLLLHDDKVENDKLVRVSSDDVQNWINERKKSIDSTEALGLTSVCESNGSILHIPMMDFSCPTSDTNLVFVKEALIEMGFINGIIANSGRSYHFYGLELLDTNRWIKYLGKCLLLSPFTDTRYIAHRVIAGRCILRISSSRIKPETPHVVEVW